MLVCFSDDILVYSKKLEEQLIHIDIVFPILRAQISYVKKEKCSFCQEEIKYLGHVISCAKV